MTTAKSNVSDGRNPAAAMFDDAARALAENDGVRALLNACAAVLLALAVTGLLILIAGKNPLLAYWALVKGVAGTAGRFAFALNKSTPYILAGVGVALCFRAKVINIGAEGQIAVGGIGATWIALNMQVVPSPLFIGLALAAAAAGGAAWSGLAAVIRLKRGVHEVLCTLLLNFVGVLLVSEVLHGEMGEPGAGFPQSPLLERSACLPKLLPGTDLHVGILMAALAVIGTYVLLWRTTFGFRLRVLGGSPRAASYAGIAAPRGIMMVMALAGALAGVAGGIEVLGVHYRLIEGFSAGFGFNAIAVALIASINPIAVFPAGLFFGFLEAGALAMQREVGVPSSLVFVIQGLTIIFVLCAVGIGARQQRV
jgi:simple sugar transport system permease protein